MMIHQAHAKLPFGFTVSFRWTEEHGFKVEWEPDMPSFTAPRARRKFFEAYTRERNAFMADVATMVGGALLVVDLSGATPDGFEVIEPRARH